MVTISPPIGLYRPLTHVGLIGAGFHVCPFYSRHAYLSPSGRRLLVSFRKEYNASSLCSQLILSSLMVLLFALCSHYANVFTSATFTKPNAGGCCSIPPGWGSKHFQVKQSEVWGVTELRGHVTLLFWCSSGTVRDTCIPPRDRHRNASTIIGFNAYARLYAPAPPDPCVLPALATVYHGGGLLPEDLSLATRVPTPHCFAPSGKWAIHKLANAGLLNALDFTESIAKSAHQKGLLFLAPRIIPAKILRAGFNIINATMTVKVNVQEWGGDN
jgi:hypothetical protein